MLYNTEGIVIRSIAYGDTHAIVTLLTPTGTVVAMARGAKKLQSRLAAGVALCAQGIYSIYQGKGMGNIQQLEVQNAHRLLHEHLDLAAYAAYFCELTMAAGSERPNGSSALYHLFVGLLHRLQTRADEGKVLARIWETKILGMLGASPNWQACVCCGLELKTHFCYSPRDGGMVCELCVQTDRDRPNTYVPVIDAIAKILYSFEHVPFERLGTVRLSKRALAQIKTILTTQMHDFAGLSLKSRSVIESMNLDEF